MLGVVLVIHHKRALDFSVSSRHQRLQTALRNSGVVFSEQSHMVGAVAANRISETDYLPSRA